MSRSAILPPVAEDMGQALERVLDAYKAFNRGDFDVAAEHLHPDVKWNPVAEVEVPIHGRDAVRSMFEPEIWSSQQTDIHETEILGDWILLDTTFHGKGAASGIELNQDGYHLWRIKDGKGAEFRFFLDRDEAVAAASPDE